MAWTAPRTYVAGEIITAATLNTHIRDNFLAFGDPITYTAYTPSWQSAAGTNPAIGNGSIAGNYNIIGKTCRFKATITTGSTTTAGTGTYILSLPVASASLGMQELVTVQYSSTVELNGTGRIAPGASSVGAFSINDALWVSGTPAMPAGTIIAVSGTFQTA
jgi:hypothetical protein